MGEGPQTECWRGASVNFSTWSHSLACTLTVPTNIWSVVAATMQRPLKWRAEQTETGWVQCLSKVLIKPHSKYHWNQTNRSCLKALNLAMPCNKVCCGSLPLIITWKWFCQQASTWQKQWEVHSEHCMAIYVKMWITLFFFFFEAVFLSEMCWKKNYYANCTVVESIHKSLLCSLSPCN